jgi:hypothetical protein
MKHRMRGETQAQQGMTLRITLVNSLYNHAHLSRILACVTHFFSKSSVFSKKCHSLESLSLVSSTKYLQNFFLVNVTIMREI